MKTEFEMSESDLKELLEACQPVPYLVANGTEPISPQQRANWAWQRLGEKMGFKHMSVEPCHAKGERFFYAERSE